MWVGALILLCLGIVMPAFSGPDPTLHTVSFDSPAVGRTMKFNILLPAGYADTTERYAVLYLLHGVGDNYTNWTEKNHAPFYAGQVENLIVVMPDAGNSWYINWSDTQDGNKHNWEDYLTQDLIGYVDTHYRTIARRAGRALSGLSMGGYGALTLGLRHPDLFVSIGSTSGYLDYGRAAASSLRRGPTLAPRKRSRSTSLKSSLDSARYQPDPAIGIEGFSSMAERTPQGIAFATPEQADEHDPFHLVGVVPEDQMPHIYLDCGTEDVLIGFAREFAGILIEKGAPFNYMQMPGRHDSDYWTRSVGHMMAIQYEVMQRALGQRPPFDVGGES